MRWADINQVPGSLGVHMQGRIITTSDFFRIAQMIVEKSNPVPLALVSRDQLVDLLIEHKVLVKFVEYELIKMDVGENVIYD